MRGKVVISWIFVIAWMGVIFMFSSMNGEESTDLSDSGIRDVVSSVVSITNQMGITYDDGNQKYFIEKMVIYLNYPVRKCAHMFEYFVLAILVFNAFCVSGIDSKKVIYYVIGFVFIYACTDEFHQIFTGRTAMFADVLIDSLGGYLGILFCRLLSKKSRLFKY